MLNCCDTVMFYDFHHGYNSNVYITKNTGHFNRKILICNKINVYNYTFYKTTNIIGKLREIIYSNYLTHSVMMLVFYLGIRSNCNLRKKIFEK